MLAELSLKLRPLYGPFHRDMVNVSWLTETVSSSLRSGYFMLQSLEGLEFVPVLEGRLKGALSEEFELISFYSTLENFVVHAFELYEKYRLPLYSDRPLWVNLESINFNIREFFKKLQDFEVTGFMLVDNRVKLIRGTLLLQKGLVVGAHYAEESGRNALVKIIEDLGKDMCSMKVYEIPEELLSFLLLDCELAGLYQSFEDVPFKSLSGTAIVVSVSPEKYGYLIFSQGEEVFSEGFEEDAPFYELLLPSGVVASVEPMNPLEFIPDDRSLRIVKYDPEHPILYFCPACWSTVSKDDKVCPNCGYDLTEFHQLPYEYKLIMALEHPVKDMKKNVIYTVGRKDLELALPHFELMVNRETDPIILMEIADALSRMSSPEATNLLRKLAQHRYPVVRSRAIMHLQKRISDV
jgi:hypothetical protein